MEPHDTLTILLLLMEGVIPKQFDIILIRTETGDEKFVVCGD